MIKKLQLLPSETDESAQNIDDDDLAQGIAIRLSQFKENNLKIGGGNQSQVNKFHRILKNADGEFIKRLHNLNLGPTDSGSDGEKDSEAAGPSETSLDDIEEVPRDDTDDDEEDDNKDLELFPVKFLAKIAKEQRFDVTYVEIEEVSKKGAYQCLVQLSTVPVAVCFGKGETTEAARVGAAENALDYLKIMTKK